MHKPKKLLQMGRTGIQTHTHTYTVITTFRFDQPRGGLSDDDDGNDQNDSK